MIISRRLTFLLLPSLIGMLIICLLIPLWVAHFKDEKEVDSVTSKTHQEIQVVIKKATTTLLFMNSSATNLAKIVLMPLGQNGLTFSQIQAKVTPILLEALLTIPRVSQISYMRTDGSFFALYSQAERQIFAVYSNTSFSKATSAKINHQWYTQRVDPETRNLYGEAVVFPASAHETWLQPALNTTHASTLLGSSWDDANNPLVLNVARVNNASVISLGFELKSLLNIFSNIKPFGGGLYLATKNGKVVSDGIPNTHVVVEENGAVSFRVLKANGDRITLLLNYEMSKTYVIDISGTTYVIYPSSLDINGIKLVYVLALPYDEVQRKMHLNLVFVSVLSSLMILTVAISMALTVKSARKESGLRVALIKQKEATRQLERKSRNQSVAFETASHDIRASLGAISASVEASINENHQGSELVTNLRNVESSTKDLQGLLNSILDTSKIEAGKMELEEKPFDLVKVLEGVVDLFYPVGLKKEIDVILDLQDDLLTKFSQVKGDERRLKQILSNLLSNAIKFTSEGYVSVRVRARARSRSMNPTVASNHDWFQIWRSCFVLESDEKFGDFDEIDEVDGDRNCMEFVFEVNDTGKGIAKEKQSSIFENYVQVKENEHEFEGTGLGLAIVQSLVRLMGGEISIVDKEAGEKGTCFMFHVVFKVLRSDQHVTSEEDKISILSSGSNTPFCSPLRKDYNSTSVVLFISGDERRKVTQKFLRARGVKVFAAKNVGELSETLKEFRQSTSRVCSSGSYLNLSFGYLKRPGRSPKEVPLSALDGTDGSTARMNNRGTLPGFILLVVDTTRADFRELSKVVAEFRKDSKDACFRVVWLGFRCMHVHGLDEKQLPPSDVIVPMPLHGYRLYSLIDFLPKYRDRCSDTSPHGEVRHSPAQIETTQEISRVSPSCRSPLRGKKVLLVEDNSTQQLIAKRILLKNGVIFDTCTNGKEALTLVSKGLTDQKDLGASHILPYDYILMDCQMPVMDGCEATRHIRLMEKDYGVHIPIIGLTAHAEGEEFNKFVKEIDINVSKPLNEQKLLKVIKDLHSRS